MSGQESPPPFDLSRFRVKPLSQSSHKVETARFAAPVEVGSSVREFVASLPRFLGASALLDLAEAIAVARAAGRPVVWGMGGHVVKVGLSPILLDLAKRGFVQAFVMNGAAAIHDAEIALHGSTSEDVGAGLLEGEYGTSDETGSLFAEAAAGAAKAGTGLGTALGEALARRNPPHADLSLLCGARAAGIPVTVHVAIGTDTVHMHPACDGAAVGAATHADFRRLASIVEGMDGGVYVNLGSAVVLPEVFLKAVAIVHNAGGGRRVRLTTGNLDMLRHYRPRVNVVERPAEKGYDIAGHHELTLPLLRAAILVAAESSIAPPAPLARPKDIKAAAPAASAKSASKKKGAR